MLARVKSGALQGVDAYLVEVEVDLAPGMPYFATVGLPEVAVKESKDRVRAALKNSGYKFPGNRVTINLAPADVRKEGTGFDLPVALGILAAQEIVPQESLEKYIIFGELSLDGRLKPTRGILSMALATREAGLALIIPRDNAREAAVVQGIEIYPADTLAQLVEFLCRPGAPGRLPGRACRNRPAGGRLRPGFQRGQGPGAGETGPAAGRGRRPQRPDDRPAGRRQDHAGPTPALHPAAPEPGRGPGDLQDLQRHGAAPAGPGAPEPAALPGAAPHHLRRRAHRRRHHPRPGEVSLAHHGVLFLDELPEFKRSTLEVLRQPLEDGVVTISRAATSITFPARFMLVASMNPCFCGYYGDAQRACTCAPQKIQQYRARISGPLLDRIDIQVQVAAVPFRELAADPGGEGSADMRTRVSQARQVQESRFARAKRVFANAQMTSRSWSRSTAPWGRRRGGCSKPRWSAWA